MKTRWPVSQAAICFVYIARLACLLAELRSLCCKQGGIRVASCSVDFCNGGALLVGGRRSFVIRLNELLAAHKRQLTFAHRQPLLTAAARDLETVVDPNSQRKL